MGPIIQKGLSPFFGTHDSLELIFSELLSIIVASRTSF
jgi:phosphofructokinase-like protein